MSTTSSGRSDAGKNWRGTKGSARKAATRLPNVTAMVIQRTLIAPTRKVRKTRTTTFGFAGSWDLGGLRSTTPSNGANSTATNHETNSAMVTTAKIEKVYSPAALCAKPIGTKPAAVTKVPVSMGKASDL